MLCIMAKSDTAVTALGQRVILTCADHFRYSPINRHSQSPPACLKGANTGTSLLRRGKRQIAPTGLELTGVVLVPGAGTVSIPKLFLGRQLMDELAPFLRNLGMSQYIGTFADNDIDGAAL